MGRGRVLVPAAPRHMPGPPQRMDKKQIHREAITVRTSFVRFALQGVAVGKMQIR